MGDETRGAYCHIIQSMFKRSGRLTGDRDWLMGGIYGEVMVVVAVEVRWRADW